MNDSSSCARSNDLQLDLPDSGAINVANFCGQKLVVFFCATDPAAARKEIDSYDRLADEFQHAGGWVIGIAGPNFLPVPARSAHDHVRIAIDADGAAFNTLAACFPTAELDGRSGATILIDRDGVARQAWPGPGHAAEALTALRDRR